MPADTKAKLAIVTGAGRAIGRAVALKLAGRGTAVVVVDLDPKTTAETAETIARMVPRSLEVSTDVTDPAQVARMVERTLAEFGRVDILVNNARWTRTQPFLEDTPEYWDNVFATNFLSQVHSCRAVFDPMIKQGGGCIVNVSPDTGRVGSFRQAAYAGAKAAVIGFSKSLVLEFSK